MRVISQKDSECISTACETLSKGGVLIAPTDTVYGLLADATNASAIETLITIKDRPPGKPISIFVPGSDHIDEYADTTNNRELINSLLPGPYTLILPSQHNTSSLLESETGTLGIRYPDNVFIQQLLKSYGKPVTATSANLSGNSPHHSFEALEKSFPGYKKDLIALAIDGGTLPARQPSTVVDLTGNTTLRQGDMPIPRLITSYRTRSEQETGNAIFHIIRSELEQQSSNNLLVLLKGNLGTGKTTSARYIGQKLQTNARVISPTFVVTYEYETQHLVKKLYHYDFYTIEDPRDAEVFSFVRDAQKPNTLTIAEWPEKIPPLIKQAIEQVPTILISLEYSSQTERNIHFFRYI